jgi:hypothetical protein
MNAQAPSHRATILALAMTALLLISATAHAVFYTPYDNWSTTTSGSVESSKVDPTMHNYFPGGNDGVAGSMQIVGFNNLSGLEGQLNLVSLPMYAAGTISFTWSYTTADLGPGRPPKDSAGYFIIHNGVTGSMNELARNNNPSQVSGVPVTFSIDAGDRLGFWVYTKDNIGGAPTFTISNFSGPLAAVPEASAYLTLAFAGLVVAGIARRRKAAR